MASGQDFFDACCRFIGEPYSTNPGRTLATSGFKDCSGLVAAGYQVATGTELGAYVTVTIFNQAVQQGLVIPYDEAINTVGACIFKPDDPYQGWGPNGHMAVSDGQGGTVEATPPSVRRLPLSYNAPWSPQACLLPGINYGAVAAPASQEDDNMVGIIIGLDGLVHAYVISGGVILYELPAEPRGAYNIPQAALDYGTKIDRLDDKPNPDGTSAWDRVVQATANALAPAVVGPPAESIEGYSDAQVKAEVDRRVAAGAMTLTGALVDA